MPFLFFFFLPHLFIFLWCGGDDQVPNLPTLLSLSPSDHVSSSNPPLDVGGASSSNKRDGGSTGPFFLSFSPAAHLLTTPLLN